MRLVNIKMFIVRSSKRKKHSVAQGRQEVESFVRKTLRLLRFNGY